METVESQTEEDTGENTPIKTEHAIEILSDLQSVCRICLNKSNLLCSLLTTKENTLLMDMFSSITSIKVHPSDGLPLQICEQCEYEVVHCYQFRMKCKESHSILKCLIGDSSINKYDTKIFSSTSMPIESGVEWKKISDAHEEEYLECKNEIKIQKEQSELEFDIEVKEENEEVTEVEYLDEGLFDSTKDIVKSDAIYESAVETENHKDVQSTLTEQTKVSSKLNSKTTSKKGKRKYYTCSFCSKNFLKSRTLKDHIKQTHGQTHHPFSCGQCKESFSTEQDLHIHSALHSKGSPWTCNQCNKEFQERGKLRRHIRRHMQSNRHACDACGKQFAERCALRRHARVHTGQPPDKKYACHICDNKYSESGALSAHMLRHAGLRPCACDTCGKTFPSPRLLASHRRVHSDRKPHACAYCDKRFRHESTRNTHHRTHTGEKPYVCSACGKRFIQNSNLTLHMRTHTGEKPYKCDICERKFSSGSALASHRRTHTGEKPYGCPICGKRFGQVYLSAHMRLHSGERPFACRVCHKRFASAAAHRHHLLTHTGEKPFECAICSEKFKTKAYLAKHLKNHEMIKRLEKRKILVVQKVDEFQPFTVQENDKIMNLNQDTNTSAMNPVKSEDAKENIKVEVAKGIPMEVTGELILPDNGDVKTQLVVIDQGEGGGNICLRTNGVNFENNDINYGNDVNLVTVNEGEVNISSSAVLEGTTVKLYQLDQSLVQIHTSGGQVTISKITSKMTANFE